MVFDKRQRLLRESTFQLPRCPFLPHGFVDASWLPIAQRTCRRIIGIDSCATVAARSAMKLDVQNRVIAQSHQR
jgi:hypothetical protein